MKVIYLGTPKFAVKPLTEIINSRHEVVAVVTQLDKAGGRRGNKIVLSPVKVCAHNYGLKVLQFERIKDASAVEELKKLDADIMVTCAYGQILSQQILDMTKHGVINIHASLLPKYRGASPVQHALIDGEEEIGVTIMQTALEVDSGDIILQDKITLKGDENSQEALDKLAPLGARLVVKALDLIEDGKAVFGKQDHEKATYCGMLKKEDGKLDFSLDAVKIVNFIRGMNPWPGAFTHTQYGVLKVKKAEAVDCVCEGAQTGEVVESSSKAGLIVKCGMGCLKFLRVQGENAKEMDIADYLRGKPIAKGARL